MELPNFVHVIPEILLNSSNTNPPVILKNVVALWAGLSVTFEDIDSEGFIIDLGKTGGHIIIKKSSITERQRYTLAHELGHWYLKEYGIDIKYSSSNSRNENIEKWCNKFASELLMPTEWFRGDVLNKDYSRIVRNILSLPHRYSVSREAVFIRVSEITPISLYLAILENSKMSLKHYISRNFPIKVSAKTFERIITSGEYNQNFFMNDEAYCSTILIKKNKKEINLLAGVFNPKYFSD